jgi:hypothetical protein
VDAATIRRHHDGDSPTILPIQTAQAGLQMLVPHSADHAVRAV